MRTRRLSSFRSATSWWAASTLQGWPGVGYWMSSTSKQVSTFTTPGRAWASEMSMDFTQPLAMVLWSTAASSTGWGQRSSVYLARPVTLSAASTRGMLLPTSIKKRASFLFGTTSIPQRRAKGKENFPAGRHGSPARAIYCSGRGRNLIMFFFREKRLKDPGSCVTLLLSMMGRVSAGSEGAAADHRLCRPAGHRGVRRPVHRNILPERPGRSGLRRGRPPGPAI